MTMQINVVRSIRKRGGIDVIVFKQDNDGNQMSGEKTTTTDVRIARAILDNTIHANPRVGKVRIKWEV